MDDPFANRNQALIVRACGSKGRVGAFETFSGHPARSLQAVESRVGRLARCFIFSCLLSKVGSNAFDIEYVVDDLKRQS